MNRRTARRQALVENRHRAACALLTALLAVAAVTSACHSPSRAGFAGRTATPATQATLSGPAATATSTSQTATTHPPSPPPSPGTPASVQLRLVDRSRPTVSHGRPIASSRALTTTVWYPAGPPGAHALIVFAHGYGVGVAPYVRACQVWARAGFVVAAPSFPLTDKTVAGSALDEKDMVNQPADVSFVVSALLAATATPGAALGGMIDPSRIAVVGHSDGADTALAVTYLPVVRDRRIRAVIAEAPDPLPLPAGAARLVSDVPLLLVHGDHDQIAPFSGSQQVLAQLSTPGWFLTLRGADHLSPIEGPGPWTQTLDQVTTDFLAGIFTNAAALNQTLARDVAGTLATLRAIGST